MAKFHCLWFSSFFFLLFAAFISGKTNAAQEERKIHIVYMGAIPDIDHQYSLSARHAGILQEVIDGSPPEQHLVRSYTRSFNAFAANLTEQEYQKLTEHEEVVSVFPSKTLQLLTTESWDFTGLSEQVHRNLPMEKDVIIGILDTGIWPESKSFSDTGLGPVPKKWKGTCDGGKDFKCNGKIIGAHRYSDTDARDYIGHGSHTASTAAGNNVPNVSFYGIGAGTARGGVPSARIAAYKVCSTIGCSDTDILAAFDDAIADGVDILSLSLGAREPVPIKEDSIAIGAFHALQKGILTVHAAGNSGFSPGMIASIAPWLFSVAASSTKRKIISKVTLKNGKEIEGRAVNAFKLNETDYPLLYGRDLSKPECGEKRARICAFDCLDQDKIQGKILICREQSGIEDAISAGALGAIVLADVVDDVAFIVPLPASILNKEQFEEVEKYYNSTKNPRAGISYSVPVENKIAPVVASFSSRGPNDLYPDILKPDITAPGVDILAAYSPKASPSHVDKRSVSYSFLAGTSMACPHVSGGVAYVKSHHPDWSPSALKSAIMTTAWRMNISQSPYGDAEFSYGSGHFDPVKALDPGLVYETTETDYVKLICSMKLGDDKSNILKKIFGENISCTRNDWTSKATELNYPSMSAEVDLKLKHSFSVTFPRTVTNVGKANSTYKAITHGTPVCNITVNPSVLSFQALNEKKSFKVTVSGQTTKEEFISASLEWSDGVHSVRSPIVIY